MNLASVVEGRYSDSDERKLQQKQRQMVNMWQKRELECLT